MENKQNIPCTAVDVSNRDINSINLLNPVELDYFKTYITSMISSDKSGIKTVADGIAVFSRARDLSLPFTACLEHIHVINGKTGIDVHLIKALLSRAGVTWECTKDYAPQYEYTDGSNVYSETLIPDYCKKFRTKEEADALTSKTDGETIGVYPVKQYADFNNNIYKDYQIDARFIRVSGVAEAKLVLSKPENKGKIPVVRIPATPVDYVTEYKFTRRKEVLGKIIETSSVSHFSFTEAQSAKLFEKDTYVKYARTLIGHRAFTYGARDIASDILFGVMETTELKILSGTELQNLDVEEAEAIEIK